MDAVFSLKVRLVVGFGFFCTDPVVPAPLFDKLDDQMKRRDQVLVSRFDALAESNAVCEAQETYHGLVLGPFHPRAGDNLLQVALATVDARAGTLLDAGCGIGNAAVYLPRHAERSALFGLDASLASLAVAVSRPQRLHAAGGSLSELGFRHGVFDTVLCVNAVFPPPERPSTRAGVRRQFEELRRVAKTGAFLVGVFPSFEGELEAIDAAITRHARAGHEAFERKRALRDRKAQEHHAVIETGWHLPQCLHTVETLHAELSAAGWRVDVLERLWYPKVLAHEFGYPRGDGAWDHFLTATAI